MWLEIWLILYRCNKFENDILYLGTVLLHVKCTSKILLSFTFSSFKQSDYIYNDIISNSNL